MKKTDLPVIAPAEITNSNVDVTNDDDNDSNYSKDVGADDDLDDDDDLMGDDEEDEMVADEAAAGEANSSNVDDLNGEYDSGEDLDNYEEDGGGAAEEQSDSWDLQNGSSSGAKPAAVKSIVDEAGGAKGKLGVESVVKGAAGMMADAPAASAAQQLQQQQQQFPTVPSTSQPTVDPYFTHFDPHYEHQSYKVSQKVSVLHSMCILSTQNRTYSKTRKPNSASRNRIARRSHVS